jgi:hypothetical protein
MTFGSTARALCFASLIACALLHAASFLLIVPGLLILVPFFLMVGAILCARAAIGWNLSAYERLQSSLPRGKTAVFGRCLLVYAVLLFVHFYRSSGGASGVGIIEGQYVYKYKSAVIRPISEEEYKAFPAQVARIMSAWIGMMATFCLSSLINQGDDRRPKAHLN